MGWDKNTDNAECDGCGYKEISVKQNNRSFWHDERRYKADAVLDEFLFCGNCHDAYTKFCQKQDGEFAIFERNLRG